MVCFSVNWKVVGLLFCELERSWFVFLWIGKELVCFSVNWKGIGLFFCELERSWFAFLWIGKGLVCFSVNWKGVGLLFWWIGKELVCFFCEFKRSWFVFLWIGEKWTWKGVCLFFCENLMDFGLVFVKSKMWIKKFYAFPWKYFIFRRIV